MKSAWCAIEPRMRASTSTSIDFGSSIRSTNQIDEQPANASSSVAPNIAFDCSDSRTVGSVSFVERLNASSARVQPALPAVGERDRLGRGPVGGRQPRDRPQPLALAGGAPRAARPARTGRGAWSRATRPPGGAQRGRPPRTGSAGAERRRRSPPRARGRAAATVACTPCRRGTAPARPDRASPAARRRRARGGGRRRGTVSSACAAGTRPLRARARTRPRCAGCARAGGRRSPRGPVARRRAGRPRGRATRRAPRWRAPRRARPSLPARRGACAPPGRCAGRSARPRSSDGFSSPYAACSIEPTSSRTAAIDVGAERSRSSGGSGPPRSSTIVRLDPLGRPDPAAAQAALEEVGVRPDESGVRRADEREQIAPRSRRARRTGAARAARGRRASAGA